MPKTTLEQGQVRETTIQERVMPAAEEKTDRFDGMDIWEAMFSISATEWAAYSDAGERTRPGYVWYLYRALNGQNVQLGKFNHFREEDSLSREFGGPELQIFLQDAKYRRVKQVAIKNGLPPIFTERERSSKGSASPAGQSASAESFAAQMVDVMREELARSRQLSPQSNPVDGVNEVLIAATKNAMEIVKAQVPAAVNPAEQMKTMLETMRMMGLVGEKKNNLLETLKELREAGLIPALGAAAVASDPIKQAESLFSLVAKVQEFTGAGGGKRASVVESIAERLIDKGPEIVKEVRQGIERVGQQRIALEQMRHAPPGPQAAPVYAQNSPATAMGPQSAPPAQDMPLISEDEAFKQLGAKRVVKMIFDGEDGGLIMQFLYGLDQQVHDYVLGLDAAGVRELLAHDGVLSQALQYPHLDDTIAEIVEYSAEERTERAKNPPEPAPVN